MTHLKIALTGHIHTQAAADNGVCVDDRLTDKVSRAFDTLRSAGVCIGTFAIEPKGPGQKLIEQLAQVRCLAETEFKPLEKPELAPSLFEAGDLDELVQSLSTHLGGRTLYFPKSRNPSPRLKGKWEQVVLRLRKLAEQDRRFRIMGLLSTAPIMTANESVLLAALPKLGHYALAEELRADLAALEAAGWVRLSIVSGLHVAQLTPRGHDEWLQSSGGL